MHTGRWLGYRPLSLSISLLLLVCPKQRREAGGEVTSGRERRWCCPFSGGSESGVGVVGKAGRRKSDRPGFKSRFRYFLAKWPWRSCPVDGWSLVPSIVKWRD